MKTFGFTYGVIAIAIMFLSIGGHAYQEPSYQGLALSSWVAELSSTNATIREDAKLALGQIGTNALPYLVAETRALGLLQEQNKTNFDLFLDLQKRHLSIRRGFETLGPVAKPAVPEMVSLLDHGICPLMAGEMLILIDTNAASLAFIQAMTNQRLMVRFAGAEYLVSVGVGTNTDVAVTVLIQCLNYDSAEERSFWLRSASAGTLGGLRLKPQVAVPALMERLQKEKQSECRVKITKALGEFGTNAVTAVPMLRQLTNDSDAVVKILAVKSLKQIEGKTP